MITLPNISTACRIRALRPPSGSRRLSSVPRSHSVRLPTPPGVAFLACLAARRRRMAGMDVRGGAPPAALPAPRHRGLGGGYAPCGSLAPSRSSRCSPCRRRRAPALPAPPWSPPPPPTPSSSPPRSPTQARWSRSRSSSTAAGLVTGLARRQYVLRVEQAELRLAESTAHPRGAGARRGAGRARADRPRDPRRARPHRSAPSRSSSSWPRPSSWSATTPTAPAATVRRSRQLTADGLADARTAVARAARRPASPARPHCAASSTTTTRQNDSSATFTVTGPPRAL